MRGCADLGSGRGELGLDVGVGCKGVVGMDKVVRDNALCEWILHSVRVSMTCGWNVHVVGSGCDNSLRRGAVGCVGVVESFSWSWGSINFYVAGVVSILRSHTHSWL